MAEKKQNKSSIVQNKGVGSEKNTFEGKIQYLPLDQLVDFKNHPFKVEMNTELYELIAGHRRKAASKWAGAFL